VDEGLGFLERGAMDGGGQYRAGGVPPEVGDDMWVPGVSG
jgi:hypothetical protein